MSNAKTWVVLTVADLYDYVVASLFDACRTRALGAGQTDPFPDIMANVANRIRVAIETNSQNLISATPNAVPPELKDVAAYMILEIMQVRILLELNEDQKKCIERAWKTLGEVRRGEFAVSIPVDPLNPPDVQRGAPAQVVTYSRRTVTQCSMKGI